MAETTKTRLQKIGDFFSDKSEASVFFLALTVVGVTLFAAFKKLSSDNMIDPYPIPSEHFDAPVDVNPKPTKVQDIPGQLLSKEQLQQKIATILGVQATINSDENMQFETGDPGKAAEISILIHRNSKKMEKPLEASSMTEKPNEQGLYESSSKVTMYQNQFGQTREDQEAALDELRGDIAAGVRRILKEGPTPGTQNPAIDSADKQPAPARQKQH